MFNGYIIIIIKVVSKKIYKMSDESAVKTLFNIRSKIIAVRGSVSVYLSFIINLKAF